MKKLKTIGRLHAYTEKLLKLKETVVNSLVIMGGLLFEIKRDDIYKEQYDDFNSFLGDPEISISRPTAYRAMSVYEVFVNKYNKQKEIEGIDPDKLYILVKIVDDKNIDEWIERAKVESRSDLRYAVRKEKKLPALDPSKHIRELIKEFLYEYCKDQAIEPDKLELEELLFVWEEYRRNLR